MVYYETELYSVKLEDNNVLSIFWDSAVPEKFSQDAIVTQLRACRTYCIIYIVEWQTWFDVVVNCSSYCARRITRRSLCFLLL